jgi:hypothetical protein
MYTTGPSVGKPCLPFGRWKGRALGEVDVSYLQWVAHEVKLSTGIRAAVEAELQRRGVAVPEGPPPAPPPSCCGSSELRYTWHQFSNGTMQVRRSCPRCGRSLGFAPRQSPYTDYADASASPTALLDALLLAEAEGVELVSDGSWVGIGRGGNRASPELRDALRQQGHLLASLLGRLPRAGAASDNAEPEDEA